VEGFLPRNVELKGASRELRSGATAQEERLWYCFLRDFRPRFTRQRIIGNYIADFFCHKAKLVVELDGSQHYQPDIAANDAARTEYFNALSIEVIRFPNREVDGKFEYVCDTISAAVHGRMPGSCVGANLTR
jgi:very-short-patch-repair endonuclease